MRITFACLLLTIVCGFSSAVERDDRVLFEPGALPDGAPEAVLPAGAVVHAQLGDFEQLLADIDDLVMAAIPPEVVPDRFQGFLDMPEPTLAILGKLGTGMPMTRQVLRRMAGVDSSRPLTGTIYVGSEGPGLVLSVPVADYVVMSGMALNLLRAERITSENVAGQVLYRIEGRGPDLPRRVTVVCGADRLYLCTADRLALALIAEGPRLNTSPLIATAVDTTAGHDLWAAVDMSILHPLARAFAERHQTVPVQIFQDLAWRIQRMRPDQRRQVEFMLQRSCGIGDLDVALAQVVAVTQGTYAALRPALLELVTGCEGLVVAADIDGGVVRQRFSVHGEGIVADADLAPVPRPELERALGLCPPDGSLALIRGRATPANGTWELWRRVLGAIRQQQEVSRLSTAAVDLFIAHAEARRAVPALAAQAPWTLHCSLPVTQVALPRTVIEFFKAWLLRGRRRLTVLPGNDLAGVIAHGEAVATAETANATAWTDLQAAMTERPAWLLRETRFRHERASGRDLLFTERSFRTTFGLFGASQHELINRTTRVVDVRDGLVILEDVGGDPVDLPPAAVLAQRPLQSAETALLDLLPADLNRLCLGRGLAGLPADLAEAGRLEDLVWAEVEEYRRRVVALHAEHGSDPIRYASELRRLPMPQVVESVIRTEAGVSVRLAGGLVYPRPRVLPVLEELLAPAVAKADEFGGYAAYTRLEAGSFETGCIIRLDGLTHLIRSVISEWVATYGTGQSSLAAFRGRLKQPGDGDYGDARFLLINPLWKDWLLQREESRAVRW